MAVYPHSNPALVVAHFDAPARLRAAPSRAGPVAFTFQQRTPQPFVFFIVE